MFVSYARVGEDAVLWRALSSVDHGTYVDVGPGDPFRYSVTRAFYERGWSGVNIEARPDYANALVAARPRDRTFSLAAGRKSGPRVLRVAGVAEAGERQARSGGDAEAATDRGGVEVPVRTLDELLDEAGLGATPIHFVRIAAGGGEADVLAGFDLARHRPWVVLVSSSSETTSSSREPWERSLSSAGYSWCRSERNARFYASPDHLELREPLSSPVGPGGENRAMRVPDHAESTASRADDAAMEWRARSLELSYELNTLRAETEALHAERARLAAELGREEAERQAMLQTLSWRVTKPLRMVRALRNRRPPIRQPEVAPAPTHEGMVRDGSDVEADLAALRRRVGLITTLLDPSRSVPAETLGQTLLSFQDAVRSTGLSSPAVGWLAHLAATGAYPTGEELERAARTVRRQGPTGLTELIETTFESAARERGPLAELEVLEDRVLIDLTHTVRHDLHTGIQRVTRECAARWTDRPDAMLVGWDDERRSILELSSFDAQRIVGFRASPDPHRARRGLGDTVVGHRTLVPWRCTLLIPELATEPIRCDAYRSLAMSGVLAGLSLIVYDPIPVTAHEVVTSGMSEMYAKFVSLLKHATNVCAISEASGHDFEALCSMFVSQGLAGPLVTSRSLPVVPLSLSEQKVKQVERDYRLGRGPLVLVVGSHEPRKNHATVLEAAEGLWKAGRRFELLFVGGSGWRSEAFDAYVESLRREGRAVSVHKRVDEETLWALYRLARFTVFPSLSEGYGLPIAESLASGTPVITSNYGAMAEVARGGGAVLTDPRDPSSLEGAMDDLLTDDDALCRLQSEARKRVWVTWDDYAQGVWDDLVAGRG
jgi:FkbM family methyltransferase